MTSKILNYNMLLITLFLKAEKNHFFILEELKIQAYTSRNFKKTYNVLLLQ